MVITQPASASDATAGIWLRLICSTALCLSLLSAVFASRHWPLIGDTTLMHYVVFLMHRGLLPYKDIADVNLPGTYAFEASAMWIFGDGAAGWRVYDFTLLGAGLAACFLLAGRKRWFAALFAGCIFALVHLQDGLAEGGQRDLLITVLLLWSYAALFAALRGKKPLLMTLLFGVVLGTTFTIKPVLLPLGIALLLLIAVIMKRRAQNAAAFMVFGAAGMAIPGLCALLWLQSHGVLSVFLKTTLPLVRFHAGLGIRPLGFLFTHCLSPIVAVCLLWALLQFAERPAFTAERVALLIGVFGTILAYILQGKGFPYQRYPQLAILLLLIGLDLDRALFGRGLRRAVAIAMCVLGCFFLAPRFAWLTTTFSGVTPFQNALAEQLGKVEAADQLSGNVQCLDTFGGCIGVLYNMRVRQSTGFLYDCYLFTDEAEERERYRAAFWAAYKAARPQFLIVTNQFCFWEPRGFEKLDRWPAFAADINSNYREQVEWHSDILEHFWHRFEVPYQFKIYVRRESQRNELR